jgi:nitrate reductase NapAB chaperone NapD
MPISGITVTVDSMLKRTIRDFITKQYGGEISAVVGDQLVVVLEAQTNAEMKDKFEAIAGLTGVICTQLAYYNEEDCTL